MSVIERFHCLWIFSSLIDQHTSQLPGHMHVLKLCLIMFKCTYICIICEICLAMYVCLFQTIIELQFHNCSGMKTTGTYICIDLCM